ncbi:hypothetical protein PLESTB_000728000 [Pleodorina starrii]|uniref:RING-CH-type domain-containing protein n=1 Tax=Pleodorina starrii TaxID=330485 RepID=A0A9W6BJE4_9CHLO|nr:hypothetical protein PLESTM_000196200 [Pleodorina starrii]GLC53282.1 hypothetical protein PLESTB_000728000 [Pleodorina starrii]GLC67248.1 hypothetical protein PLESTF_000533200 [Pleodorina starrii]
MVHSTDDVCWICFTGAESAPLMRPCPCPRYVHRGCLGRWQLQCAGRSEESHCRFCGNNLPRLDETLTPDHLRSTSVPAYMAILYNQQYYVIPVRPGVDSKEDFSARVKKLIGLPDDAQINVSFQCAAPTTGELLTLSGIECFNAAATCAAISAAKRAAGEDAGFVWHEPVATQQQ